ncbi:8-oxo-dGTP diphosphatase [Paenibacillus sp. ALJ109b]|uniref:8-oxo-dGTP diphosphatase n=1 Tax=Paenibacillus sp. ALJ109b TaxID=2709068 RepID=UPI0013D46E27|nr:8-oxo-dGTP diphosphatase [Paenibacillus sp. ALJ109b]NEU63447.1 8-oxo-dGTP diphosphatase [Paenibacillus sp. ALJ109b]
MDIRTEILTMCMIWDKRNDQVLLMNRPNQKGFPGYIAPGGKVDFPESIVDGAMREVKEETGLVVKEITYKGLDEFCDPEQGLRYMVFNYLATSYEGELLSEPPEGELLWVSLGQALELPMQDWFTERFPRFFQAGTFERSVIWEKSTGTTLKETFMVYSDSVLEQSKVK